jgi:hypothetical protein
MPKGSKGVQAEPSIPLIANFAPAARRPFRVKRMRIHPIVEISAKAGIR